MLKYSLLVSNLVLALILVKVDIGTALVCLACAATVALSITIAPKDEEKE